MIFNTKALNIKQKYFLQLKLVWKKAENLSVLTDTARRSILEKNRVKDSLKGNTFSMLN